MIAGPGKPFIAGNWKMNLTVGQSASLAAAVVAAAPDFGRAEVVLVPPFTSLAEVRKITGEGPIKLGAQNCFWEDAGAFTGEVSAPMVKDAGCRYVVVGHSERRQFFGETDLSVNKKLKSALKHGLSPIFCLGEVLDERRNGRTEERILAQLSGGLDGLDEGTLNRIVIAYEPVWAIGTGQTATPSQAEDVHAIIRDWISKKLAKKATSAIILYGGSVKPDNAFSLYGEKNIDGFLVGGASLGADSFLAIIKEAIKADRIKQ